MSVRNAGQDPPRPCERCLCVYQGTVRITQEKSMSIISILAAEEATSLSLPAALVLVCPCMVDLLQYGRTCLRFPHPQKIFNLDIIPGTPGGHCLRNPWVDIVHSTSSLPSENFQLGHCPWNLWLDIICRTLGWTLSAVPPPHTYTHRKFSTWT